MSNVEAVLGQIRSIKARKRISTIRLANAIGKTGPAMSKRLGGTAPINIAELLAIAVELDCSPEDFFRAE